MTETVTLNNISKLIQDIKTTHGNRTVIDTTSLLKQFQSRYIKNNSTSTFVDLENGVNSVVKGNTIKARFTERLDPTVTKDEQANLISQLLGRSSLGLHSVDDLVYKPSKPLLFPRYNEKGDYDLHLNSWENPNITSIATSSTLKSLLDDYFAFLSPDETERNELLKWCASVALRPEKPTVVALLLFGLSNGTGKGTLAQMLKPLVGASNCFFPDNAKEFVTGRFKDDLEGKTLVMLDEIYVSDGKNPYLVSDGIKQYISESTLSLDVKGGDRITIENHTNWIATTNNNHPISIKPADRRWLVFKVEPLSEEAHQHQKEVCSALHNMMQDYPEAFASEFKSYLEGVDITNYKPWVTGVYRTKARTQLIENSKTIHEEEAEEVLKSYNKVLYITLKEFRDKFAMMNDKSITKAKAQEYLVNADFRESSIERFKLDSLDARNVYITPYGLSYGLHPSMNAKDFKQAKERAVQEIIDNTDEANEYEYTIF